MTCAATCAIPPQCARPSSGRAPRSSSTWRRRRSCAPRWRTRWPPTRSTCSAPATCSTPRATPPWSASRATSATRRARAPTARATRSAAAIPTPRRRRRRSCVAAAYRESLGVRVATARAGNVIGGGDWARDRLLPDLVRAREAGEPLVLRHPDAVRPWQHVLDPLAGYLLLAERLHGSAEWARRGTSGPRTRSPCGGSGPRPRALAARRAGGAARRRGRGAGAAPGRVRGARAARLEPAT